MWSVLPECTPMRIAILSFGIWRILKSLIALRKCRDIVHISTACLLPLLIGKPLATMYASPIVSTWKNQIKNNWLYSTPNFFILKHMSENTYFIDIVQLDDVVKEAVKVIEEGHHLHCRAYRAHGCETNNVWEEDGHHVIAAWFHRLPCHQLISDIPGTKEAIPTCLTISFAYTVMRLIQLETPHSYHLPFEKIPW